MNFITDLLGIELFGINQRVIGIDSSNTNEPNHTVLMVLQLWENDAWANHVTLPMAFVDGKAYVNLSSFFDMGIDVPATTEFDTQTIKKCVETHQRYKITFSEYYGDVLETPQGSISVSSGAIKGGVETIRARTFGLTASFITAPANFFNQQPATKSTTREQAEFMYFFLNILQGETAIVRTDITLVFSDGTGYSYTKDSRPLERGLYRASAGFQSLDLQQYETVDKQVISYVFRIRLETNLLGVIDYHVEYDTFDWEQRYFLFENNLGGLDTLRTDGKGQETMNVKRRVLRKVETPFVEPSAHTHDIQNSYVNQRKVSTGWIDADVREWLKTFFISPNVWLYLPDTHEMIPVTISDRSASIHKDDNSLQDISFTYNFVESQAI